MKDTIEWEDVQRIVLSGYKHLPNSAYVLWRFRPENVAGKRAWLAELAQRLTPAVPDPSSKTQPAINLALTYSGLRRLGIAEPELNSFSLEFIEGMAPRPASKTQIPRRTNVLGDLGASSPACWDWGGWDNDDIDGLLLLFAPDETSLDLQIKTEAAKLDQVAERNPIVLKGRLFRPDMTEHFGYVDGLSQPKIEGRPKGNKIKSADKTNGYGIKADSEVKPGEFLLGYFNERRARVTNGRGRDVRRNGTYLVFRQLEQDVPAFNAFLSDTAQRIGESEEWVAARLLGRWRNGEPLVAKAGDAQPANATKAAGSNNDFLYYYEDRSGLTCPIGAHIRRANPRDSLGPDPETALGLSKMHRIIRRGRPYGERWQPDAAKAEGEKPDGENPNGENPNGEKAERGMLFIALNADIAGQFEMIQHSWLNNPHFDGLYTGTDPISHFAEDGTITIQNRPVNIQIRRPKPFVRVRGGAYFFLPGIRALRDIAASA